MSVCVPVSMVCMLLQMCENMCVWSRMPVSMSVHVCVCARVPVSTVCVHMGVCKHKCVCVCVRVCVDASKFVRRVYLCVYHCLVVPLSYLERECQLEAAVLQTSH